MKLRIILAILIFMGSSVLSYNALAQKKTYTCYGYASCDLDYDGDEHPVVVSNIVRFTSTFDPSEYVGYGNDGVKGEIWSAFSTFFDTYYKGYLDMGLDTYGHIRGYAFETEQAAIESRRKELDSYSNSDYNILLIHNFTMTDRGSSVRRFDWSKGRAPQKEVKKSGTSSTSSSSSNKSTSSEKPTVYKVTNRLSGEVRTTTNWAQKRQWEAEFAEDNKVADASQKRTREILDSSNRAIRQGADSKATSEAARIAAEASVRTNVGTYAITKAGTEVGMAVANMFQKSDEERWAGIQAKANKMRRERQRVNALKQAELEPEAISEWSKTDQNDILSLYAFFDKYSFLFKENSESNPIPIVNAIKLRYRELIKTPASKKTLVEWLLRQYGMTLVKGGTLKTPSKNSITVDHDFYIGTYEVTCELWGVVNRDLYHYIFDDPEDIREPYKGEEKSILEFIDKLNKITGLRFRLPTETEWEFAARGGIQSKGYKYSGSNKWKKVAWFRENRGVFSATKVGLLSPNELGIYDMSGNLWERCQGNIVHGGSADQTRSAPNQMTLTARKVVSPKDYSGFRLVLDAY